MIPNAEQMLVNVSSQIPDLISLATALMYVTGMYIIVVSIAGMRNAPTISSPGQGQVSMWTLIKHVFVGAALIYFPSTVHVAAATLFAQSEPYAYIADTSPTYKPIFDAVTNICLLIGVIAVGKGVYELGFGQGQNSQEKGHTGPIAKGITHILAGACLINLDLFLSVVLTTLGIHGIVN